MNFKSKTTAPRSLKINVVIDIYPDIKSSNPQVIPVINNRVIKYLKSEILQRNTCDHNNVFKPTEF